MYILSLDLQRLGDWLFKLSVNALDGGLVIVAFHQKSGKSIVGGFTTPEVARDWVTKTSLTNGEEEKDI